MFGKVMSCAIGAMFVINLGGVIVMMAADMVGTALEERRWRKWAARNGRRY